MTVTVQLKQYKSLNGEIVAKGVCGQHVLWTLDFEGTLYLYGKGKMYDYKKSSCWVNPNPVPWLYSRDDVKPGWVESGATHPEACTFDRCPNMTEVHLPSTTQTPGDLAVHCCSSLKRVWIPDGVPVIPDTCFKSCSNLKENYIPSSVTEVERFAFTSDFNLTTVYYGSSEEDREKISISTTEDANEYLLNANIIFNSTGLPSTPMENYP